MNALTRYGSEDRDDGPDVCPGCGCPDDECPCDADAWLEELAASLVMAWEIEDDPFGGAPDLDSDEEGT